MFQVHLPANEMDRDVLLQAGVQLAHRIRNVPAGQSRMDNRSESQGDADINDSMLYALPFSQISMMKAKKRKKILSLSDREHICHCHGDSEKLNIPPSPQVSLGISVISFHVLDMTFACSRLE